VVEVLLGRKNSDVLPVIRSLISSSFLDKSFTNLQWEMQSVTTLQNDQLYQQYM